MGTALSVLVSRRLTVEPSGFPMEAAFVNASSLFPPIGESSFVRSAKSGGCSSSREQKLHVSKTKLTARFNFFGSSDSKYAEWASDLFETLNATPPDQSAQRNVFDFSTMYSDTFWANEDDITAIDVTVTSCIPVTASGDLMEVTVDVSDTVLTSSHVAPGQFVQLGRDLDGGRRGIFTIASPPGRKRSAFQFLVSKYLDPLQLCNLLPGDTLRVSPVAGTGANFAALASTKHIYALADCPQGFAAVRSLIEWDQFRTACGSGANRTTKISLFYSIAGAASLPYTSKISEWALYGINFIPVQNISLSEHMKSTTINEDMASTVHEDEFPQNGAFVCVAEMVTANELFVPLQARGVTPSSFFAFTEKHVMDDVKVFEDEEAYNNAFGVNAEEEDAAHDENGTTTAAEDAESDEQFFDESQRRQFEDEIWMRWVGIRDAMRSEFEKVWVQNAASQWSSQFASKEAAKKEAWGAWFATNRDAWRGSVWDDARWNAYWDCWTKDWSKWSEQAEQYAWGSSTSWQSERSSRWRPGEDEFWESSRTSNDRSGRSSWGSWSSSSQRAGGRRGWGDWKSWNRSSGSNKSGFSNNFSVKKLDFYAVLGLKAGATSAEIKRAYRKKALQHHPDLHPEKKEEATVRMQEIVIAYMTLKDASKRFEYDRYGL